MKKQLIPTCCMLLLTGIVSSCSKILDVPLPEGQVTTDKMFDSDESATNAVIGLYSETQFGFGYLNGQVGKLTGLYTGEITRPSPLPADLPFLQCKLTPQNITVGQLWLSAYKFIGMATTNLHAIARSKKISREAGQQLTGELSFIRALCYFYLVNLFDGVPIVNSPDYLVNSKQPRATAGAVYDQIIADLKVSMESLPATYPASYTGRQYRTRANKWAAAALLARVCLYRKDWTKAAMYATAVIEAGPYRLENNPDQVFLAGSQETILQLQPVNEGFNTAEGAFYLTVNPAGKPPYQFTADLLNRFEPGDQRKTTWIRTVAINNQFYSGPYKFKTYTATDLIEMNIVLRLAEMYLVLAEANAQQHLYAAALQALNTLRTRAAVVPVTGVRSQEQLLSLIEQERYLELFTEWGHRFFDLRRTASSTIPGLSRADDVLATLKGKDWESFRINWPIPEGEILLNNSLQQNKGY